MHLDDECIRLVGRILQNNLLNCVKRRIATNLPFVIGYFVLLLLPIYQEVHSIKGIIIVIDLVEVEVDFRPSMLRQGCEHSLHPQRPIHDFCRSQNSIVPTCSFSIILQLRVELPLIIHNGG